MMLFTSSRERLYWMLAIIAQLIIYSTLGIQPDIAKLIRASGLMEVLFIIGFALLVLAIILLGFLEKLHWKMIALSIGILAIITFGISRLGLAEERTHLFEYAFIGALVYLAVNERRKQREPVIQPVLLAIILVSTTGIFDEVIQYFIPNRAFDPRDILFNVLACSCSIIFVFLTQKLGRKR